MGESRGKWALVTGGGAGIGQAVSSCFAENGYRVIAVDNASFGDSTNGVIQISADIERVVLDQAYAGQFGHQVDELTEGRGLTALINNAAVQLLGHCAEVTREDWARSFNTNLAAPFFLSQLFLDSLEKNAGSIVNMSSIHAAVTKRNFVTYATTKAALSALTRNMAVDLGAAVRVNAIEPAAISTDMLQAGFEGKDDKYAQLQAFHPAGRIGSPREIAELALFLCSEGAAFLHGACVSASGGIHACLHDPD